MTAKGTKEEWIGIDEWPVFLVKEKESDKYILNINDEIYSFVDYQSFASFFEQQWIGKEITPWENYNDTELEEWCELIKVCDGIPLSING